MSVLVLDHMPASPLCPWPLLCTSRPCETEQDLVGPLNMEAFLSRFLFVGYSLQPPSPSLSPNGKFKQSLIREVKGCRDKGEAVRKHQHSQGPGPPGTKAPSKWQMSAFFIPEKTTRGEMRGTKEAHQEIKRSPETRLEESCTCRTVSATLPLNHCNKNSSPNPPRLRHTASKDKSPLCPLLPGKAIQLFFSILPKTLSEIQFSTGKQRLSFQHHMCSKLVEGTRGRRKFPILPLHQVSHKMV